LARPAAGRQRDYARSVRVRPSDVVAIALLGIRHGGGSGVPWRIVIIVVVVLVFAAVSWWRRR
jgi:hypothetical protein